MPTNTTPGIDEVACDASKPMVSPASPALFTPTQRLEANRLRISDTLRAARLTPPTSKFAWVKGKLSNLLTSHPADTSRAAMRSPAPQAPQTVAGDALSTFSPAHPLNQDDGQAPLVLNRFLSTHPLAPMGEAARTLGAAIVRERPFASVATAALLGLGLVFVQPWKSRWLLRAALGSTLVSQAKRLAAQTVAAQSRRLMFYMASRAVSARQQPKA